MAISAIIGGGLVGGAIARQLEKSGQQAVIIKRIRPSDEIALPAGTQSVFITAQSRDSHSAVATDDLTFVNADLVAKVLAAAHSGAVRKICLFSTGSVYRRQRRPIREDDPIDDAPGPYAKSKIEAEGHVRDWAAKFDRALILRPFMIYGPGLAGNRLFARLPIMVRQGREISLAQGQGLVTNPVHAEDAARCAIQLMNGSELAVFNVAGNEIVNLKEIVDLMAGELGLKPRIRETEEQLESLVGDIDAMRRAGAVPQVEVHDGMRAYYRSLLQQ